MKKLLGLVVCLLLVAGLGNNAQADDAEWNWVLGQLDDVERQDEYVQFAERVFSYYQEREFYPGKLVFESELTTQPGEHTVYLGPIGAYKNTDWFRQMLNEVSEDAVVLGGVSLTVKRTGIYLRNQAETRLMLTGLSLDGFKDVFTVPTGERSCTIVENRTARYQGDYEADVLELVRVPFLPLYPTSADLDGYAGSESALVVEPVWQDSAQENFTPAFVAMVRRLVQDQKVLFVGETHWSTGVNRIYHDIIEVLLADTNVRSVFLEVDYSFSGYYNHYVMIKGEAEAELFLKDQLHPMVAMPNVIELLGLLREWNCQNPDKPVRVACVDMEWSLAETIERTLKPYFGKLKPGFDLPDPYQLKPDELARELATMRELLDSARAQGIDGQYPFLTPDYIENILQNVSDTVTLDDFNVQRQAAINRNITEFSGDLLGDGLAVFKGGGFHAVKEKMESDNFYRDAAFLNEVFEPTKGKVATLLLRGIGSYFTDIQGLDLDQRMGSATNYNRFVREFQQEYELGFAKKGDCFLLNGANLGIFEKLTIREGYRTDRDAFLLVQADPKKLAPEHDEHTQKGDINSYDEVVYILRSKIETTRPLDLE